MVKNPPANTGDTRDVGSIPGSDPWVKKSPWRRKEMATHSSILAWEIPWTEEPDGLQSMALPRVGYDRAGNTFSFTLTMTAYNYFHFTDVETEARRLNGLLKVT